MAPFPGEWILPMTWKPVPIEGHQKIGGKVTVSWVILTSAINTPKL